MDGWYASYIMGGGMHRISELLLELESVCCVVSRNLSDRVDMRYGNQQTVCSFVLRCTSIADGNRFEIKIPSSPRVDDTSSPV